MARLKSLAPAEFLAGCLPDEAARGAERWPAADLVAAELSGAWPAATRALVARADEVVAGRLRLFGRSFPVRGADGGFDWRFEPPDADLAVFRGDPKFPWEVARHGFLPLLGVAWRLTGERRYAELAAGVVHEWARAEPVGPGLHYDSALEVGVRLIAWCQAFQLLQDAPHFDVPTFEIFFRQVASEAAWLEGHLSDERLVAGNHLLGELAGLIVVDLTFTDLAESEAQARGGARRLDRHLSLFAREIERQIFPDGVSREQSTTYGRFVADFVAAVLVAAQAAGVEVPSVLTARAAALARWLAAATQPDGTLPLIGDNDNGRGADWGEDLPSTDARGVWRTLAVLAGASAPLGGDLADDADFGVALWLGMEGVAKLAALRRRAAATTEPPPGVALFGEGGHAALRGAPGDFAFVRCGPFGHGLPKPCAHSHADFMAPVVWLGGAPLLIDPGCFGYTTVGNERALFQSGAAHSLLMVDGVPLGRPKDAFRWAVIPPDGHLSLDSRPGEPELRLGGRWRGTGGAGFAVALSRTLVYTERQRVMRFDDSWDPPGEAGVRTVLWRWRFSPECVVTPTFSGAGPRRSFRIRRPAAPAVDFVFEAPPGDDPLEVRLAEAAVAPYYAALRVAPVLEITWRGRRVPGSGFRTLFKLVPDGSGEETS